MQTQIVYEPTTFMAEPFAYDGPKLPKLAGDMIGYMVQTRNMGRCEDIEIESLKAAARKHIPLLIERGMVRVYNDARGIDCIRFTDNGTVRPCDIYRGQA